MDLSFFNQDWVAAGTTIGVVAVMFYTFVKGVRDILDKTPATDDNWFERTVTLLGKMVALFGLGKRP